MRKDIKAINEAFRKVISESNQSERNFDDVMDDIIALKDKGHIKDASQAIDILNAELGRDLTDEEDSYITNYFYFDDERDIPAEYSEDAEESAFSKVENAPWSDAWSNEDGGKGALEQIEDRLHYLDASQLNELLAMVKDAIADQSMLPKGYKPSPTY